MTRATKQLSGAGKDKFFKRFFDEENALEPEVAKKLAEKSASTFSSVRVRSAAFDAQRAAEAKANKARPAARSEPPKKSKTAKIETAPTAPPAAPPTTTPAASPASEAPVAAPVSAQTVPGPQSAPETQKPAEPFDAYAIGLVPTCQREGPEGLMAKLADIASTENLREMARLQRIVIPLELRKGEAKPQAVREAIVAAVAKSIADKKTAAG